MVLVLLLLSQELLLAVVVAVAMVISHPQPQGGPEELGVAVEGEEHPPRWRHKTELLTLAVARAGNGIPSDVLVVQVLQ